MNYLSHFVIDHQSGEHYYNTALILPDITKRWIKTFKTPSPPNFFTVNQLMLLQGAFKHYESDKQFHSSAFFEKYQSIINEKLKTVPFSDAVNRKWFIAHILFELLIDRSIVKNYPELVDSFYRSLSAIDDAELSSFLTFYGMDDTARFFEFFNHFRQVKYIYYYADNNKFIYSLNRIMLRVGMKELTEADASLLLQTILEIESTYLNEGKAVLHELKEVFI